MKKSIAILILLALVTGGVFAQGTNIGVGLLYDGSWNNGAKGSYSGIDAYEGFNNSSFGGFVYLDFTYVEISVSLSFGSVDKVAKISGYDLDESNSEELGEAGQFGITLLS